MMQHLPLTQVSTQRLSFKGQITILITKMVYQGAIIPFL